MASANKPHPPKPMYPMYPPEEHKRDKPKPKPDGARTCLCFRRKKRERSVVAAMVRERVVGGGRLEFWSVYGVPYFLLTHGIINCVLSPILGVVFWNDCPGLPNLIPVLLSRLPLGIIDAVGMFLLSAEAFGWSKSYRWIRVVRRKLNWRMILGMALALFLVWGVSLFMVSRDPNLDGKSISYDPGTPPYCHKLLYKYAYIHKVIILIIIGSSVALFTFGSLLLLILLCIVSRF